MSPAVLVMAKAPVPGRVKTRLGALVGAEVAAQLATACILDTLDVCETVFTGRGRRHVALAGALEPGRHDEVAERLARWTVHPQRGDGFASRLAHAHDDVGRAAAAPVVQIGMDTPQLSAADLQDVADRVGKGNDAVLGPADDGGWWVLALAAPVFAQALGVVRMSTTRTYADTLAALRHAGARVATAAERPDVDTAEDAARVAAAAPWTRFARLWEQAAC